MVIDITTDLIITILYECALKLWPIVLCSKSNILNFILLVYSAYCYYVLEGKLREISVKL